MTIAAILDGTRGPVVTIDPGATVAEAAALLDRHRIGAMPVVRKGRVEGVFSERDVIRALARGGAAALTGTVADAMSAPALVVQPGQHVLGALSLMTERRVRHLPVVADGELVGIVSIGDLVKHRIDRIEADAAAMRDYIQQV